MTDASIHVCRVRTPDGMRDYVTLVRPELAFSRGLVPQAIVGVLSRPLAPGEAITPEIFSRNSVFNAFLHEVIARHGPEQPGLRAEAERIGDGVIVVVDQRTPTPDGDVPPEDIFGIFLAKGGKIVPGSYQPGPKHRLLTADGFFRLDAALAHCLLQDVEARSASPS